MNDKFFKQLVPSNVIIKNLLVKKGYLRSEIVKIFFFI